MSIERVGSIVFSPLYLFADLKSFLTARQAEREGLFEQACWLYAYRFEHPVSILRAYTRSKAEYLWLRHGPFEFGCPLIFKLEDPSLAAGDDRKVPAQKIRDVVLQVIGGATGAAAAQPHGAADATTRKSRGSAADL